MRSREQIEAVTEEKGTEQPRKQAKGRADHLKEFRWAKGQSGNAGGRPKRDFASELCRAVIEQNPDEVYKGLLATLRKGSAFALQVAADRGYGKLKESVEVSGSVDLVERLKAGRKRVAEGK